MNKTDATWHYENHSYDFEIQPGDIQIYCTTKAANELGEILIPHEIAIVAVHPEFLGWTIEEIMDRAE